MARGYSTLFLLLLSTSFLLVCYCKNLRRGCVASRNGGPPICRDVERLSPNVRRRKKPIPPDATGFKRRDKEKFKIQPFWIRHNEVVDVLTNDTRYKPKPAKFSVWL